MKDIILFTNDSYTMFRIYSQNITNLCNRTVCIYNKGCFPSYLSFINKLVLELCSVSTVSMLIFYTFYIASTTHSTHGQHNPIYLSSLHSNILLLSSPFY